MNDFNKIVKILWRSWWKVIFKDEIHDIIDPDHRPEFNSQVSQLVYRLKANGDIISLKAWVYIVPDEEDKKLNSVDLWEKYYLKLAKKYITQTCGSQYYISWTKALEFHMKNYSIPEKICVINRDVNKRIKFWANEIVFKTLKWKKDAKTINLFARTFSYHNNIDIWGLQFKISCLELSLLESSLVDSIEEWIAINTITKAIKKYGNILDHEIFENIAPYKYNMSFNRLKELSRNINQDLYNLFLDCIKKNWGNFVWEWLRNIL